MSASGGEAIPSLEGDDPQRDIHKNDAPFPDEDDEEVPTMVAVAEVA